MVIEWILENWTNVIEIYLSAVGLASLIVKITPTLKDDTFMKNLVKFTGKFIALNRK